MAIKKFLMENGKQVWPITRADCIYNVAGDELLSNVVDKIAQDLLDEVARAKAEEARIEGLIADEKNADKEGSLANKIAANDAAIKQEAQDRADAVKGVQDQLDALVGEGQGSVKDQIDAAKEEMQEAVEEVQNAFNEFKEQQEDKNEALDQKDADLAKAIECYEKASEHHYHPATTNLAYCYEVGIGVEQNIDVAISLYEKAAKSIS